MSFFSEFETSVFEIIAANPQVNHAVIGMSRLNRAIHALTIGHGEKSVLVNATHHANEWITTLVLTRFIKEYANEIFKSNITMHCIPLVNPDGAEFVTDGFSSEWKANICGVDLNSNYPAGWDIAKKNKFARGFTKPGPRDYVGPAPLSEPESCAMAAYTTFYDIDITISLHTQGEEIYWRYPGFNPPGAEELARRFAAASGYKLEEVPDESSHAGYRDWFIQTFNRPGFTIECGLGENPLPLSQFNDIYKKVSELLKVVIFP